MNVCKFASKELFTSIDRDLLDLIDKFAATIIPFSRVAFGVFVGQHGALALQYRSRHEVLRGDHLKATALAAQFGVQQFGDLRIGFADRRVESIGRFLRKR